MLTDFKRNRSLTFYQSAGPEFHTALDSFVQSSVSTAGIATTAGITSTTTNTFNTQLNGFLDMLNAARAADAQSLNLSSANAAARNRGVYRAWQYEKADVIMGGTGSENWSEQERQSIIDNVDMDNQTSSRAGVRGTEGHHQQNVADHPDQQANPDNIKFYRTRAEHLQEGHDGDWHNESNKPTTDKNAMLKRTNSKRVTRNELRGLGLAIAIGTGVGLTIGFITSLAQNGISPETVKIAAIDGLKAGCESGALSLASYGVGRTIGEVASRAVSGVLKNTGLTITANISTMVTTGVVGSLTIAIFSTYQFVKLKLHGMATREALIRVGKQSLFSLSLLAVSIAAQGIWGGTAGIIVSLGIGIIMISYSVTDSVHQRHFAERIRVYTIDKCYPTFSYGS